MASTAFSDIANPRLDRLTLFAVLGAGLASALLLLWALGTLLVAAVFLAVFWSAAALLLLIGRVRQTTGHATEPIDWALTNAAIEDAAQPVAVTDRAGRLVCANRLYGEWFAQWPAPPGLSLADGGPDRLADAGRAAWRDGEGVATDLTGAHGRFDVAVVRAGVADDHLVWRFTAAESVDLLAEACAILSGEGGNRLGAAGVMAAIVDGSGRMIAANRTLLARALGKADAVAGGRPFVDLLAAGPDDHIRLLAESETAEPLRLLQIPLDDREPGHATIFLMFDEEGAIATRPGARSTATTNVHALLAMLPLGLALAERDGRILFMNEAFERAASIPPGTIGAVSGRSGGEGGQGGRFRCGAAFFLRAPCFGRSVGAAALAGGRAGFTHHRRGQGAGRRCRVA